MTEDQFRRIIREEQNQFRHEVLGRLGDMDAKLDTVKNNVTIIKGKVVQIDSRLTGVEGDIRAIKQDIAEILEDRQRGEDWRSED